MGHTQEVEGTYPRDSISREQWGGSHRQRAVGAGPIEWHSCSGIQTFGKNTPLFGPLLPLCSLSNQWHFEANPLDYGSPERRTGGAGLAKFPRDCRSPAGFRPARAYFPWKGRSHLLFHLELKLQEQEEGG